MENFAEEIEDLSHNPVGPVNYTISRYIFDRENWSPPIGSLSKASQVTFSLM